MKLNSRNFLALDPVNEPFKSIDEIVTDTAFFVVGDDGPVNLVATGSGASLPVVRNLVSDPIEKKGRQLRLRLKDAVPDDLRVAYPRLAGIYPQLAVAIGGYHPELPTQISSVTEGIRDPGSTILRPVYR